MYLKWHFKFLFKNVSSVVTSNFLARQILKFIMEERVQGKPLNPSNPPCSLHSALAVDINTYPRVWGIQTPLPCWVRSNYARGFHIFILIFTFDQILFAFRKQNYAWNNLQLVQDSMYVLFSQKNICGQSNTFQNI